MVTRDVRTAFVLSWLIWLLPSLAICEALPASDASAATPTDGNTIEQDDGESGQRDPVVAKRVTSLPPLDRAVHDALQSRDFQSAVEHIDQRLAAANTTQTPVDYLLYLKGRALTELDMLDAAVAVYERIEGEFADGGWASRARFGRADVAVRRRDYATAGRIYQQEAERLLARDRKDELADIYLEFADRYFEGIPSDDPARARKPDFASALAYYREALELGPTVPLRQKIEFRVARCFEETGQMNEAIDAFRQFLNAYGGSQPSSEHAAQPHVEAQARYRLGDVLLASGQRMQARRVWQDLNENHALLAESNEAAEWMARARYRLSHTYGMPNPPSVAELELGVAAAESFISANPNSPYAATAELEIAQGQMQHGRYEKAVARLSGLIANPVYEDSDQIPLARRLRGQAYAAQQKFDEAVASWKEFLEKHPTDPHWSDVQKQIIDAEFGKGMAALLKKQYAEARRQWQTFLNKYPLDPRVPSIMYQFGAMQHAEALARHLERIKTALDAGQAAQSVKLNDACRELYEAAIVDWRKLVAKYPNSDEASRAALQIATTLEDRLGRLKEALEAYKHVSGSNQDAARQRIARLTEPQLEIATGRKFRSDEVPRIHVTTRNLEQVDIKIYQVDMEDYFRKMHLARGIESLDIALIDPDEQLTHNVADYEQYRRIDDVVELPKPGVGVMAVTVSSETLEATTMVVVSDLDIVAKISRNELFLFAQNMRTQQPVDGASVLISDGAEVFAAELTGKDGVLQKPFEQLKTTQHLRVFVVHDGHMASTVTNLNGLDFAVGLTPRGYVYTDRPVYRAGQLVNIKGIVRWVEQDQFVFKSGQEYELDVYDARGRLIHEQLVALNGYGTVSSHVILPESAAQGEYRVHLHEKAGKQSYETRFEVTEYRLEPVSLTVEVDRDVLYRGETVKGAIHLQYYYGTPLVGETVQYRFGPEGELQTGKTDENGKLEFVLETREFNESQVLTLAASYPNRNLQSSRNVYLATRGFSVTPSTLRDVYLNGETFDVTMTVVDPAGQPVGTELTLEVLRRSSEQLPVHGGLETVRTSSVRSADETGEARQTLKLDEPGRYVVRATGTDRFGNDVSGETVLRISGEQDSVRLRILADAHHYQVGDEARIRLHWREAPALALVTYEGASVLGYQLIHLERGDNIVPVSMTPQLAPNFILSVAVMEQQRFHTADAPFVVAQRLQITLTPQQTELKPGETLEVDIVVTDPQGQPVAAELSLSLVQTNLLEMFQDIRGAIDVFFSADTRTPQVRQATSCTFEYRPDTRGISRLLLAEAERRETLERELAVLTELREANARGLRESLGGAADGANTNFFGVNAGQGHPFEAGGNVDLSGNGTLQPHGTEVDFGEQLQQLGDVLKQQPLEGLTLEDLVIDQRRLIPQLQGGQQLPMQMTQQQAERQQQREQASGYGYGPSRALNDVGSLAQDQKGLSLRLRQTQTWTAEPPGLSALGATRTSAVALSSLVTNAPESFRAYLNQQEVTVNGMTGKGRFLALNNRPAAELRQLVDEGTVILPGMSFSETGFWDPTIVTDSSGKATVRIPMPARSTAWRLAAKGINDTSLAGQAESRVVTRKELFGELRLPLVATDGDNLRVPVEIHSTLEGQRKVTVTLRGRGAAAGLQATQTLNLDGPGVETLHFAVSLTTRDEGSAKDDLATLELNVESDAFADTSQRIVRVRPNGMPVYASSSGTAAQSTLAHVAFQKDLAVEDRRLELVIGPSVNRALLDAVLTSGLVPAERCDLPSNGLERAVSDVLGGVALLEMIGETRDAGTPQGQALVGKVSAGVALLVSSQRDDGGWSWGGRFEGGTADRYLSARAMWAFAQARTMGFAVPQEQFQQGKQYLQTAFAASLQADRDGQCVLLHAMAVCDCADFAFINRLYRERNQLSKAALLHLALALHETGRTQMGTELLNLTINPNREARSPWLASDVEVSALELLACELLQPADPRAAKLAEELEQARLGARWPVEKANGPAIAAMARWYGSTRHAEEKYTLKILVNDQLVETLTIDPSRDGTRRIPVANEHLVDGQEQQIRFELQGRGEFSYSAILSGFLPTSSLQSTVQEWYVTRRYEPALRMFEGREVPRGFSIVDRYSVFYNEVTETPVGDRIAVTLHPRRRNVSGRPEQQYAYLVLSEPIPAGCTVLDGSISGSFERYEIEAGRINFYLGDQPHLSDLSYTLVGYVPGSYKTVPTALRDFYDPSRLAVGTAKDLTVLDASESSRDDYRLSPDELYHLGRWELDRKKYAVAHEHLSQLFDNWRLRPEPFQTVVEALLRASLALNRHADTVKFFELIKEKMPDIEVSFENILQVALSYRELGEYERSYLVYRATIQGSFERESQTAGFLEQRGEFLRSVQVLENLFRDYPAEAYLASATYSLAQETYRRAPLVAQDQKLKEAGINRVHLIRAAIEMLDHFLSTFPSDPAADEASFALATALLDLDQYETAIQRCRDYAKRYPSSRLIDSFWYIVGYSHFELGAHQDALSMCRQVAEAEFPVPETGATRAADNKWEAVYIMGQVYHSLGKAADAIAQYAKVKDRFADAAEAIEYFTRKEIAFDDVTTLEPGAAKQVELRFRNIPEVSLKVYRIDLMKFGLMQRNLDRITAINLAGIRPYHEQTIELGDGKDYRDRTQQLELPLKDEGAYLVVCRGESLYASGLVVVTPLSLEVREDATSGRVRVTVKDRVDDKYVGDVHVKVIGSVNDDFRTGQTDLRGLFIADDVKGTSTVIALADESRYAFYRGSVPLQNAQAPEAAAAEQAQPAAEKGNAGQQILRGNIFNLNYDLQLQNNGVYNDLLQNQRRGVKSKEAY